MEFRKVKDMAKSNKGNTCPRNENQKKAATLNMILHNPMFNKESRRKSSEARKGRKPTRPFQKNNQYWKQRKDLNNRLENSSKIPITATPDTSSNVFEGQKQQSKNASITKRKTVTCRPVRSCLFGELPT